jgi:hypothetical protein
MFDSWNPMVWTWQEWAVAVLVGYIGFSLIWTTGSAVDSVRDYRSSRRRKRAAAYRRRAKELEA